MIERVGDASSRLLGATLAMSAALCKTLSRESIIRQFDELHARIRIAAALDLATVVRKRLLAFDSLERLREVLDAGDVRRTVIAISQLGSLTGAIAALHAVGLKLVVVVWALDRSHRQFVADNGSHVIDLAGQRSARSLISVLSSAQAHGYIPVFRFDAHGNSRKRYQFFGYNVGCANLVEVYTRLTGCRVIQVHGRPMSDGEISVESNDVPVDAKACTQQLLGVLERSILAAPAGYGWSSRSIVFSDERAIANAFSFLPEILEWRAAACFGLR